MKRMTFLLVVVLGLSVGCCKKEDAAPAEAPKGPDKAALQKDFAEKAIPALNAAVPAGAPKVEFEAKLLKDDDVIAAVPKGWKEGVIPGSFQPPEDGDFGFSTRYGAGSNCDGTCAPKDWKATAQKVDFEQFKGAQFKIAKEEELKEPAGKLLVATTEDGKTYVTVARWKEGASKYYVCRTTLEKEAAATAPLFEKACLENIAIFLK